MRPWPFRTSAAALLLLAAALPAHAIEVKVSADALERTLRTQLFNGPEGRYYIRGNPTSACYVFVEKPSISFRDDRVVIHVHAYSRLGEALHGACLGVGLDTEADVSVVPEAEGETVGFRDARIERLSNSHELNFLLEPFLSRKLPSQMKLNAADLIRSLLAHSESTTGYDIELDVLKLHSMQVDHNALVVDTDANLEIH